MLTVGQSGEACRDPELFSPEQELLIDAKPARTRKEQPDEDYRVKDFRLI
jgi:hypothetical protein